MTCAECGKQWDVSPRPDGTMPVMTRCPKARGGCGKLRRIPQSAHAAPGAPRAVVPAGWDPPSQPRSAVQTTEACPGCGASGLLATPRSTARYCRQCKRLVIPGRVAAPYQRGTGSTREARSQRERDLEALELARRKGIMRGQLDAIAADDRLTPESLAAVEWFAEQVRTATTGQRLDELADLYAAQKIRRRGWLQGRPPAITAGYPEDPGDAQDDEDEDWDDEWDDEDDSGEPGTAVVLATPGSIAAQQHRAQPPQPMTWLEAVAELGWRIVPVPSWDGCQISADGARCPERETRGRIGPPTTMGGWACAAHYHTVVNLIGETNRARGIR